MIFPTPEGSNWIEARTNVRQKTYERVLQIEQGLAPVGEATKWATFEGRDVGPEIDEWVAPPMCYEIAMLKLPGEDFAYADEEHQRCFLILAAEVLYGPNHDARLQAEAVLMANEPT